MQNTQTTSTQYPNHPVNFIVPFGAGGGTDMQARAIEKFTSQHLDQPLVVLNKPGAAGIIAWNELAKAAPDGYTIGISSIEVLLHTLYTPEKTHYLTTLDPIAQITSTPMLLVTNSSSPWNNVNELIEYAKQNPQSVKAGHGGMGSISHILALTLGQKAGITIGQVPFQSGSEVIASLLGNHVQIAFSNPTVAKEHIKAGTLKPLATTGEKKLSDPFFKDVPTLKELGFDIVSSSWYGIVAPKDLPPTHKKYLEECFKKSIDEPEFQQNMAKLGLEIEYLNSEESQKKWIEEAEAMKKTLEETGIIDEIRAQKK